MQLATATVLLSEFTISLGVASIVAFLVFDLTIGYLIRRRGTK